MFQGPHFETHRSPTDGNSVHQSISPYNEPDMIPESTITTPGLGISDAGDNRAAYYPHQPSGVSKKPRTYASNAQSGAFMTSPPYTCLTPTEELPRLDQPSSLAAFMVHVLNAIKNFPLYACQTRFQSSPSRHQTGLRQMAGPLRPIHCRWTPLADQKK